ncbi:MAG: MFS transporter [Desulfovibrionaceae bacterium]|nr:MFS transporter [Desulfovibrionaceae bacterium]
MPQIHETASDRPLLSRDFVLLFCLALLSNCYLAVYYCFEQWMEHVMVAPGWRGVLLGSLFGMVMLFRPGASVLLIKASKLPPMLASILVANAVLLTYQFLSPDSVFFEWILLALRIVQGFFLAIFGACTTTLLVSCIPPGQSARGFALFSLTFLMPYALVPTIGEALLPVVGDEPALYACTALLGVPCLVILYLMRTRLREPEVAVSVREDFAVYRRKLVHGVLHSGLGLVLLSILTLGLCTSTCIYFMKGLCSLTGSDPAQFFFYYTVTIMIVRVVGSRHLDSLPRYRVVPVVALGMSLSLVLITWGPAWIYVPATVLYGLSISLIYPLQASVIYNRSTPDTRSVNSNLMLSMFDAAALLSPLVGGGILSAGLDYHAVIMLGAVSTVLSGSLFAADGLRQRSLKRRTEHGADQA